MLEEAVTALKAGLEEPVEEAWSPTITTGSPVTIPEDYVADLQLRLNLYRRLATLETDAEIETFAAEMIDRFGPLPPEVGQLMKLAAIKALCRRAHVEKVEAGPKGVIIAFRDNSFANPQGLVRYVTEQGGARQGSPGHAAGVRARFRQRGRTARRHAADFAHARRDRREEGGVRRGRWCFGLKVLLFVLRGAPCCRTGHQMD